jgi:hypothetical protein
LPAEPAPWTVASQTKPAPLQVIFIALCANFMLVSIGTGSEPIRINSTGAARWGDVFWALPMMSIFIAGNSTVSVETDELLGNSHWRLDVSFHNDHA